MRIFSILALVILPFMSCERNSGSVAIDFVEGDGFDIDYFDTIGVISTTERFDSLVTLNPTFLMVGNYDDPVFGMSSSNFITELVLGSVSPDFGDSNVVVDSAFISLPFAGWYGDTAADFGIKISHLDDGLDIDDLYYATSQFSSSTVLCDTILKPNPSRPSKRTGMVSPNQVMFLKINTAFLQSNIIEASKDDSLNFSSNEYFTDYFKGIQITGHANNKAIYQFSPADSDFRIRIYFTNDSLRTDTIGPGYNYFDLLSWRGINNVYGVNSVNMFDFDKTSSLFNFDNQDTVNGELTSYVQAMGGAVTSVNLKNINYLKDSNYFVNHAELKIPIREGSSLEYFPPTKLNAFMVSGNDRILMQEYLDFSTGGNLNIQSVLRDHSYTLEITKFVQQILNGSDSTEGRILLVPDGMSSTASRAVLNGNLDPVEPMSLKLYLSKQE
ncbi:MAG: DUF4270 family protein [Schleiferiaceae bacterium]|nr:DUF4270 family protein [Schleiferiaceae bacterium]